MWLKQSRDNQASSHPPPYMDRRANNEHYCKDGMAETLWAVHKLRSKGHLELFTCDERLAWQHLNNLSVFQRLLGHLLPKYELGQSP